MSNYFVNLEDGVLAVSNNKGFNYSDKIKSDKIKKVIIKDGVESIDARAFKNCPYLEEVIIADSVKSIGKAAFSCCVRLKSVKLPAGLEDISDFMFWGCESLESIELPKNLKRMGVYSFYGTGLKSIDIPDSVEIIDEQCLSGCKNLKKVELPSNIRELGYWFCCNSDTESISIENNEFYKTVDGVLFNKDGSELIIYPSGKRDECYEILDTVNELIDSCFSSNPYIKDIRAKSMKVIPSGVFSCCENLVNVDLGDINNFGNDRSEIVFWYCPNINEETKKRFGKQ